MQDGAVLDAGFVTDDDAVDVAAGHGGGPDAGARTDLHLSNYLGGRVNVGRGVDLRLNAAIRANHEVYSVTFHANTGGEFGRPRAYPRGVRHGSGTAAEVVENAEPSERRRTLGTSPASNGGGTT